MARNAWCLHSLRIFALVVNLMIGLMSNNLHKPSCYRRFSYQPKGNNHRNGRAHRRSNRNFAFVRINSRLLSKLREQDLIAESFGF